MYTGTALPRLASVSNSDLDGWIFIYQSADVEHWVRKVESFSCAFGTVKMQVGDGSLCFLQRSKMCFSHFKDSFDRVPDYCKMPHFSAFTSFSFTIEM